MRKWNLAATGVGLYVAVAALISWSAHQALREASLHRGLEINDLSRHLDHLVPEVRRFSDLIEIRLRHPDAVPDYAKDVEIRRQLLEARIAAIAAGLPSTPLSDTVKEHLRTQLDDFRRYLEYVAQRAPNRFAEVGEAASLRNDLIYLLDMAAFLFSEGSSATQHALREQKDRAFFFNRLLTGLGVVTLIGIGAILVLLTKVLAHRRTLEAVVQQRTAELAEANVRLCDELNERREAEERFHQLAAAADVAFWIQSLDKMLYVSPAYEQIWHEPPSRLYSDPGHVADTVHPDDRARLVIGREACAEGRPYEDEIRIIAHSGECRWLKVIARPICGAEGRVARLAWTAADITDFRNAQARLERSERRFRQVFDAFPDGIVTVDGVSATPLQFNPEAHQQLGYSRSEYAQLTLPDIVSVEDARRIKGEIISVREGGPAAVLQLPVRRKDGTTMIARLSLLRLDLDPGSAVLVVIRDVTQQCYVENYLRAVLDTVADGIITIDSQGRVEDFNPAAERIFGYEKGEVVGRNVQILMPEPDASAHDEYIRRHVETGRTAIIGVGREVFGRRKDGAEFPMFLAVNRARVEGRLFFTGVVRDITARKANEAAVLRAKHEAELANRSKSEFLANMSHELRTPLNAIIGFSEIMQDQLFGPVGNETYQEYATSIHESGQHLLAIINDILDISKIEAGQFALHEDEMDVNEAVISCLRLIEPRATKGGIRLGGEADTTLRMRADQRRVKQMLLNLLSNAVKFTPPGGSVSVSTDISSGDGIRITISDTGIGMSEQEVAKALRPFEQVYGGLDRHFEGTGLGLPLVDAMIRLHGGRLTITSSPGHGTTAELLFPHGRLVSDTDPEPTAEVV